MTIIFYIIIYVLGYLASIVLLHKYHKQLGMNYNIPKTYVNHDDWNSNAQAFACFSIVWFAFWGLTLFVYLMRKIIKFSSWVENKSNKSNELQTRIDDLMKGNEVISLKLEASRHENQKLKEALSNDVLEIGRIKAENEDLIDSKIKRNQWLDKAKRDSGFPIDKSFDDVWHEVLTFYNEKKK